VIYEIPDHLPNGWTMTTLGDVCDRPEYGWTTRASNEISGLKFLRTTDISRGPVEWTAVPHCEQDPPDPDRFLLSTGDIVISRAGSVGLSALIEQCPPAVFASYLIRFRPSSEIHGKFIAYFLQSPRYWEQIAESAAGIALQNVNAKKLAAIQMPVAPLQEQHRIVAAIEEQFTRLDAAVASLKRVQANLKRYRAAVLAAACSGRLVPTEADLARQEGREYEPADQLLQRILVERRERWEADHLAKMHAQGKAPGSDAWKQKYRQPGCPDTEGLPALPIGWAWTTMPQMGELNRGKSKHRPRNDPRLLGGPYPFIQTGDVRHSNGTIRSYSQTYSEFGLAQSRLWQPGTMCITIAANIAETGILTFPACFPDSVVGFVHDGDPVTVRFIELFLRTAKEDISRYAPATAQKNINLEILSDLAVPLPPLAEQHRVVEEVERLLSVAEELQTATNHALVRAERLRQSILHRAFEGELVPQDPTDEPADVLLKRIEAERSTTMPNGRQRRTRAPRAKAQQSLFELQEAGEDQ
jgi:type I restriction enzyme, S subunit